jgi:hypothetical protein
MVAEGVEQGGSTDANHPSEPKRPRGSLKSDVLVKGFAVYAKEIGSFFDRENFADLLRNGLMLHPPPLY